MEGVCFRNSRSSIPALFIDNHFTLTSAVSVLPIKFGNWIFRVYIRVRVVRPENVSCVMDILSLAMISRNSKFANPFTNPVPSVLTFDRNPNPNRSDEDIQNMAYG